MRIDRQKKKGTMVSFNGEKLQKILKSRKIDQTDLNDELNKSESYVSQLIREGQMPKHVCFEIIGILRIDPEDIDAFDLMKKSEESGGQMTFLIEPPKEKKKNINEQMLEVLIEMKDDFKEIKDELRRKTEWQQ